MKRLLLLALSFAAVATYADSYLYWMLGTDEASQFDYTGVKVKAYQGDDSSAAGTYLNLGWNNQGSFEAIDLSQGLDSAAKSGIASLEAANTGFYASLAALQGDGWSYVIELFNDKSVVGHSESLTASSAANYVVTTSGGTGLQELTKSAWSNHTYAVPEPNSALLTALGFAVLALRRRKQKGVA